MTRSGKRWLTAGLVAVLAAGGYYAWLWLKPQPLPDGFASGNGRIEATEIDVPLRSLAA
jgi:HlyD family secretion protein